MSLIIEINWPRMHLKIDGHDDFGRGFHHAQHATLIGRVGIGSLGADKNNQVTGLKICSRPIPPAPGAELQRSNRRAESPNFRHVDRHQKSCREKTIPVQYFA
jgi:hypothetical protein